MITKKKAEKLLASQDEVDVINTLLYICFNFDDWEWVQNICLELMQSENDNICGLAITCVGHLARIHSTIDKVKILPILHEKMKDRRFTGRVEDALSDINMFVPI